jgi:hypothetical protein
MLCNLNICAQDFSSFPRNNVLNASIGASMLLHIPQTMLCSDMFQQRFLMMKKRLITNNSNIYQLKFFLPAPLGKLPSTVLWAVNATPNLLLNNRLRWAQITHFCEVPVTTSSKVLIMTRWQGLPKNFPVRLLSTRFTNAIHCFEPGPQEHYRVILLNHHVNTWFKHEPIIRTERVNRVRKTDITIHWKVVGVQFPMTTPLVWNTFWEINTFLKFLVNNNIGTCKWATLWMKVFEAHFLIHSPRSGFSCPQDSTRINAKIPSGSSLTKHMNNCRINEISIKLKQ